MQAAGSHGCEALPWQRQRGGSPTSTDAAGSPYCLLPRADGGCGTDGHGRVATGAGASGAQVVKAGSAYRFRE